MLLIILIVQIWSIFYRAFCKDCEMTYIGQTKQYLKIWIKNHQNYCRFLPLLVISFFAPLQKYPPPPSKPLNDVTGLPLKYATKCRAVCCFFWLFSFQKFDPTQENHKMMSLDSKTPKIMSSLYVLRKQWLFFEKHSFSLLDLFVKFGPIFYQKFK